MTDVYDKNIRSLVINRVRSSGNKSTELRLIEIFKEFGISVWQRGYDFVIQKKKIAIFTDGCFWHGHDCRNARP